MIEIGKDRTLKVILRTPLNVFRNIVHSTSSLTSKIKSKKMMVLQKNLIFLLSPTSKVKAISEACNETLSLASKSSLSQKLSNEAENPLVGIHQSVSKKCDKT